MSPSEKREMVRGVYVGEVPTTLADGRPISHGSSVVVDSRGEDAHLVPLLAGVTDVEVEKPERSARSSRPRGRQPQENDS